MPRATLNPPALLLALSLAWGAPALGQQDERLLLPVDPDVPHTLQRLEKLAERGQWDHVVSGLDELLAQGGGSLIEKEGGFVSVRAEARERLLNLQGAAREAYLLVHRDAARRLLAKALLSVRVQELEDLLLLHPASQQAEEGRRILVGRYLERGQPGAAAVHLESLLVSANPGQAREDLIALKLLALAYLGRTGEALEGLGELPPPSQAELRSQIDLLHPPAPPPPPSAGSPLAWTQLVHGYYEVDQAAARPWTLPRADVSWVYVHDGSHASAIDLRTGKLAWRTPLRRNDSFRRPTGLCRLALAPRSVVCLLPDQGGLAALDRQSGKLLWKLPLDDLKQAAEIDFPAHLSGRPEIVGDVVTFCLVTEHEDRDVYVLAVDIHSGQLSWKAFLASQRGGSSPLPALTRALERIFVVTGLGAVAALDLKGELLWVRRYPSVRDRRREAQGPFGMRGGGNREIKQRDPSAIVSRGVLWAAPADGLGTFAWDGRSGEPRAQITRPAQGRILAPQGAGVLVYSDQGALYHVTRAGEELVGQVGGYLVARPHVSGGRAFLPRRDGVVEVELATGQARRFTSWDESQGVGSVLVAGSRLMIAAQRGLYAFGAPVGAAPGQEEALPDLGGESFASREAASNTLLKTGEAARERLVAASRDADPEVRLRAEVVLGELDRRARLVRWEPLVKETWTAQVTDLLNRLTHPNPEVRLAALSAMGTIQNDDDVLTLMCDLLQDADARVSFTAAATLLRRGDRQGLNHVAATIRAGEEQDRLLALRLLGAKGLPEDLSLLEPALNDAAESVRAAGALAYLQLGGEEALPRLLPLFADEAEKVRLALMTGIAQANLPLTPLLPLLIKAAEDENDQIRSLAVAALARPDVRDPRAFRALGLRLGDEINEITRIAASRLYKVSKRRDVLMIPAEGLEAGARLQNDLYRLWVAQIAIRYGHAGGMLSVETLTRFLTDPVSKISTRQLIQTGSQLRETSWSSLLDERVSQVPCNRQDVAAIATLTSPEKPVPMRDQGYRTLAMALAAPGRARILVGGLLDENEQIRLNCVEHLTPSGGDDLFDPDAMARLLSLTQREDAPETVKVAQALLERLAPPRQRGLLMPLLRHANDAVRRGAGERLGQLTQGKVHYDPLADQEAQADAFAIWGWGLDHPGQEVATLLDQLEDTNPTLRWQAAEALANLPLREVRNRVVLSLRDERLEWVLRAKLAAAVRLTGEHLGYHSQIKGEELRRCAREFLNWFNQELQRELAGGGK